MESLNSARDPHRIQDYTTGVRADSSLFRSFLCVQWHSVLVVSQFRTPIGRSCDSKDIPFPALPSGEEDGDDEADARRVPDSDGDPPADSTEPSSRPFLGFPIGKLLDDSPEDEPDEPPRQEACHRA